MTVPGGVYSSTVGATTEPGEVATCGTAPIGATVWYRLDMPDVGGVSITTVHASTNFDTVLALYAGTTLADLRQLACNDDIIPSVRSSALQVENLARAPYWLQVGGYNGANGSFQLQVSFRSNAGRNCSNAGHFYSDACVRNLSQKSGVQATWTSEALNIAQVPAQGGSWISQGLWFNNIGSPNPGSYLEIGDTAGTGNDFLVNGVQRPNQWERWWYWVDGYTDGTHYHAYGIKSAPNDGLPRTWIIQYDSVYANWGLWVCENSICDRWGSVPNWTLPSQQTNQEVVAGMEVNYYGMNTNTNSNVFQDGTLRIREPDGVTWSANWPNSQVQIDAGCGSGYPTNYCLNGIWLDPANPGNNWRNNKP